MAVLVSVAAQDLQDKRSNAPEKSMLVVSHQVFVDSAVDSAAHYNQTEVEVERIVLNPARVRSDFDFDSDLVKISVYPIHTPSLFLSWVALVEVVDSSAAAVEKLYN